MCDSEFHFGMTLGKGLAVGELLARVRHEASSSRIETAALSNETNHLTSRWGNPQHAGAQLNLAVSNRGNQLN